MWRWSREGTMTEFVRHLAGSCRLEVAAAAPELVLNRLTREQLPFWNLLRKDPFTVEITVRHRDREQAEKLATAAMGEVRLLGETGLPVLLRGLQHRKAFAVALVLILIAAYVSTLFVWCIRVEGNERVPDQLILRQLEELGIGFGTWGGDIVPQDLKNHMLNRVPELEWLTVNKDGGLATAVVRERPEVPEVIDRRMVTNLVASQDCLITKMEVLSGGAVCQVGDTVRKGELLISGYQDLEFCTQVTRALGEVYGRTWREQNAVTPAETLWKTDEGETNCRFALLIGKKRINLYGDSGISEVGCDKMIVYHTLTLPGGYTFPLTLVEERTTARTLEPGTLLLTEAVQLLQDGTARAVSEDMIAGEILRDDLDVRREGDLYRLTGYYECQEMVARAAPATLSESEGNS